MREEKQLKIPQEFLSWVRSTTWILILLAATLVLLPFLPWWEWTARAILVLLMYAAVFLAVGIRNYSSLRTLERYTITVDTTGIASSAPQPGGMSLSWSDITGVKDRPFSRQLEVHGPPGSRPVILPYQLEDFTEIVHLLTEQLPEPPLPPLPIRFRKGASILLFGLFVVIPIYMASGSLLRDIGWFGGTLNTFLMIFLLLLGASYHQRSAIKRLLIDNTGFQRHELLSDMHFGFHEVEAITLTVKESSAGSFQQLWGQTERLDVIVHLSGGREYSILPAGCDAFAVYQALKACWEQSSKPQTSAHQTQV